MKNYELTYLISTEISEEDRKGLQEKIDSLIQKEGGVLGSVNLPLKTRLSYPIKKNREAFFASIKFGLEAGKVENLEKELKAENKILRCLIVNRPPVKINKGKRFSAPRLPIRTEKLPKIPPKEKKVELKEIDKKLEEILGET